MPDKPYIEFHGGKGMVRPSHDVGSSALCEWRSYRAVQLGSLPRCRNHGVVHTVKGAKVKGAKVKGAGCGARCRVS